MLKMLTYSIVGAALSGGLLIISVPLFFNNPIGNVLYIITAGLLGVFLVFAISALVFRRKLDEEFKKKYH